MAIGITASVELTNFVHSLARGKWHNVTPEWALQRVDTETETVYYQPPVHLESIYGVMNEQSANLWPPQLEAKMYQYAGVTDDDKVHSIWIGCGSEIKTLFYWIV